MKKRKITDHGYSWRKLRKMTLSCLWIYLTIDSVLKLSLSTSLCPSFAANCKKLLDSGRITEHDGEMYCGSCYGKFFGPKGYGFGGGAGTLSMDDGKGYQVQIPHFTTPKTQEFQPF